MVTLASPIITGIVRDLTLSTGEVQKTLHFVIDYGADPTGVTDCGAEGLAFQADYKDYNGPVVCYFPAGTFAYFDADWMRYFKDLTLRGPALVAGVPQVVIPQQFYIGGRASIPIHDNKSVRIEPVSAGSYTVTIKNDDPSLYYFGSRTLQQLTDLFVAGQWVALGQTDIQGIGSYPPNTARVEYHKIASVSTGVVTLETPLLYDYIDTLPEYRWVSQYQPDMGGPGSMYALEAWHGGSPKIENFLIQDTDQVGTIATGGHTITLENCVFDDNPETHLNISSCDAYYLRNTTADVCEVDKFVRLLDMEDCNDFTISCQSMCPNQWNARNCNFNFINGTNQSFNISGGSIASWFIGPTGHGAGLVGVLDGVDFPNPNWTKRTATITGAQFIDNYIKGYAEAIDTTSGGFIEGQTITGATSGTTATLGAYNPIYYSNLTNIVGPGFVYGETVTSATATGTVKGTNLFGREWAVPGAVILLNTPNCDAAVEATIVDVVKDGIYNKIITDIDAWPSYSDGAFSEVIVHPCPDLTVTNCTGGDTAEIYSTLPANFRPGRLAKYVFDASSGVWANYLTYNGQLVYGKIKSVTVAVTRAYTGSTYANLYWACGQFGQPGLQLPGGAYASSLADKLNIRVNLKVTGTRVFSPAGNSGIDASDVTDDMNYILPWGISTMTGSFLTTSTSNTLADISGEASSTWPELVITVETER